MNNLRQAAQVALASMRQMLQSGEWYCAQERADALEAALAEPQPTAFLKERAQLELEWCELRRLQAHYKSGAMSRFLETITGNETPLERLRYFCSLAMSMQDWLGVETLFDALEQSAPQPSPMSQSNRLIAYCAAQKLRDLGYDWDGEEWRLGVIKEPQPEPVVASVGPLGYTMDCPYCQLGFTYVTQQPQPEPVVGYVDGYGNFETEMTPWMKNEPGNLWRPVYAAPQAQQPLTDEQWYQLWLAIHRDFAGDPYDELKAFARAIEAAHKIGVKP